MREILFRGKRLDNGEWVYGYPVGWQNEGGDISIVDSRFGACIDESGNLMMLEAPFVTKVDPSTVGQYTGLTEKNGKKIFEGDIVCAGSEGIIAKCEVKRRIDGIYYMNPNRKTVWYMMPDNTGKTTVEILGNIHDNPELLKEATE